MGQRVIRVNELLRREISHVLHTRYRGRATPITITEVDVAPNLRTARVFFSVIGDEQAVADAGRFFARHRGDIRSEVGKVIVLKYLPHLDFQPDAGSARGARLDALFDELEIPPEEPSPASPGTAPTPPPQV